MADSAPHAFDQRIAAQQAEAMHTRTRLMEIRRDGSDGRHDIRATIADLQNSLPDVAGVERFVAGRQSNVDLTEKEIVRLKSDLAAQQQRGEAGTETQEQLEEELATLARNKTELADAQDRLAGVRARFDETSDEINQLKTQDQQLLGQWKTAESQLDKYEDQNALLLKAQAKFAEADRTGDPSTAAAAQALLDQADAIAVDRDAIRLEVSQFAEVAPTDLDEVEHNFEPDPVPPFVPGVLPPDTEPDPVADQTNPDAPDDDVPGNVPGQSDADEADDVAPLSAQAAAGAVDADEIDHSSVLGEDALTPATPTSGLETEIGDTTHVDDPAGDVTILPEITIVGDATAGADGEPATGEDPSPTVLDEPSSDPSTPGLDPLPSLEEPTMDDAPDYQPLVAEEPTFDEPTYDQPTYDAPTYEEPTYEEPADSYLE